VEAAVVLELVVRNIPSASLDRKQPNPDSPVLKYVRDKKQSRGLAIRFKVMVKVDYIMAL
jgi:hypothetical protein